MQAERFAPALWLALSACGEPVDGPAGVPDIDGREGESLEATTDRDDLDSGSPSGADAARSPGGCPSFPGERFDPGVVAYSQVDIDALEGCVRLDASLLVGFEGADLRPLRDLEEVTGYFSLAAQSVASLEGLENLRTVGWWLEIRGVEASSLAPLGSLRRVGENLGRPDEGHLLVADCNQLTDLTGLGSLRSSVNVMIGGNERLRALAPLQFPETMGTLIFRNNPALSDFGALKPIREVDQIEVQRTGIRDASAFAALRSSSILSFYSNPELRDVGALSALQSVGWLSFWDNDALVALPSFDSLQSASMVTIGDHDALVTGPTFPVLETLDDTYSSLVEIVDNPALRELSGLSSIQVVQRVSISGNDALELVDLSGLLRAYDIAIYSNPLLTEAGVRLNPELELGFPDF